MITMENDEPKDWYAEYNLNGKSKRCLSVFFEGVA